MADRKSLSKAKQYVHPYENRYRNSQTSDEDTLDQCELALAYINGLITRQQMAHGLGKDPLKYASSMTTYAREAIYRAIKRGLAEIKLHE